MTKNRYDIAKYVSPWKKLDRVEISIVKCGLGMHVAHWKLFNRLSRFWLIYWNDTGGAALEFQGFSIEMTPGKMVLIPPYTLVTAHTHQPFIHNFIEFEADSPFKSLLCVPQYAPMTFAAGDYAPDLPADCDNIRKSLGLYSLVERLLLKVIEQGISAQQDIFEPRIREALKYMDDHFMKKYSVSKLCRHVNLSPSRFIHLFKEQTGITPRDYWHKQRIGMVLQMLDDPEISIPEIANELGFVDRAHLSRVIKARFGQTPAAIRKRTRNGSGEKASGV